MTGARLQCASASNSRGRSLGDKASLIRETVLELTSAYRVMTVRQVFYALVTRGIVPKSENEGYRPVQTQVLKMRREGLLPWSFIADGTRSPRTTHTYDSVKRALLETATHYRRNRWRSQNVRAQIWLEKDALAEVVWEATGRWDVPLMVSRGTSSATFLYTAAQQVIEDWKCGIETCVFALYDFDAAGARAARAVGKGFAEFAPDVPIRFELLALTSEQVEGWELPTRPAKATDPEASKFGRKAVELDAIPPNQLVELVDGAIADLVDQEAWEREVETEASERSLLREIACSDHEATA